MEQIIYGDILFIVNFSMDFLALYITSRLLHRDAHILALVTASGIGGVYGVVSLFTTGNRFIGIMINTAVALLLCFIVFGWNGIARLMRSTLVFYGVSFLMGGVMTALFNLANEGLKRRGVVINGDMNTLYSGISPVSFCLVGLVSVCFTYLYARLTKGAKAKKLTKLKISYKGKSVDIDGLCDSGNLLSEPIGSLPCVVCSFEAVKPIIPGGLIPFFREKNVGLLQFVDSEFAKKARIIPMHSVGGSGILCGFIPDGVWVNGEKKRLCIACDPSAENYADFDAIIPESVI